MVYEGVEFEIEYIQHTQFKDEYQVVTPNDNEVFYFELDEDVEFRRYLKVLMETV